MRRPGRLIGVCAGLCVFLVSSLYLLSRAETPADPNEWLSASTDEDLSEEGPSVVPIPEANTVAADSTSSRGSVDTPEKAPPASIRPGSEADKGGGTSPDARAVNAMREKVAPATQETISPGPANSPAVASAPEVPPRSPPNASAVVAVPDAGTQSTSTEKTTELVGFVVRGRSLVERLQVDDLDSLMTPEGKRYFPSCASSRVFAVKIDEQGNVLQFAPEGVGKVILNLDKKEITIRDQTHPIEFVEAVSEITMKADFYIAPEELAKILDMELEWDSGMYEYRIQVDRKLSIWKFGSGRSLLSLKTKFIEMDVPEALPAAERSREGLQLAELEWHPNYTWQQTPSGANGQQTDSHVVNLAGPKETIWGNELEGQYKVQISQPNLQWTNTKGVRWENDEGYAAQVDWFEWVQRFGTSEVTVGDSVFGLSDLVYPVFTATGVRVNGLIGWTPEELKIDRSALGMNQYFGRPQIFQGTAPIGAEVELLLNGRTLDVQKVYPQADSPPGMGVYRFDNIELPNGVLNEVTLIVREANGNEIRIEKSVVGTPQLVPEGHATYVGFMGTKRETRVVDKPVVDAGDFYGYITGGRVLYGVNDRLTVGTVLASQDNHYQRLLDNREFSLNQRPYPDSSEHAGGTMTYQPLDNLTLTGDVAASQGEGEDRYDDFAGAAADRVSGHAEPQPQLRSVEPGVALLRWPGPRRLRPSRRRGGTRLETAQELVARRRRGRNRR